MYTFQIIIDINNLQKKKKKTGKNETSSDGFRMYYRIPLGRIVPRAITLEPSKFAILGV